MLDKYMYDFEFNRTGSQYELGEDGVDLENIEGNYSIEVKSKSEDGIRKLLKLLGITEVIKGPTVVAVKELLK